MKKSYFSLSFLDCYVPLFSKSSPGLGLLYYLGVEHHHILAVFIKGDEALVDTNHIGSHAHTAVLVGNSASSKPHFLGKSAIGGLINYSLKASFDKLITFLRLDRVR